MKVRRQTDPNHMIRARVNLSMSRYHRTIKIHTGRIDQVKTQQLKSPFSIQQTIQESRFGPNCVSECSMNGHSDQCWLIELPRHFPRSQKTDYKGPGSFFLEKLCF